MNFKIITLNGKDLSGASHEEVSREFENAQEPITVVVRRNSGDVKESARTPPSPPKPNVQPPTECFCKHLLEYCTNVSHPLSSLVMSEYLRFQGSQCSELGKTINGDFGNDESFLGENEFFWMTQQEVILNRSTANEKLGITLYDETDPYTNENKVVVTRVSPGTVAARSQKIFEGDQILKINNNTVTCTDDACHLLKAGSTVNFQIGRPQFTTDSSSENTERFHFHSDDVLRDVTNYSSSLAPLQELSQENNSAEYAEILSERISCNSSITAESNLSKHTSGSQSAKDSGICHTLESRLEDTLENEATTKMRYASTQPSHSHAGEFTYIQPQEYNCKKQEAESKCSSSSKNSAETNKTSVETKLCYHNSDDLGGLKNTVESFDLGEGKCDRNNFDRARLSSIDELDDNLSDIASPWVHIAHQEYIEKMRQLQLDDARSLHPAMLPVSPGKFDLAISTSNPISDATDNTSSAYNTGESFRSSASENSRSNEKTNNSVVPIDDLKHKNVSRHHYVTMMCSSDANSDGEGPACYLTHNEGSDSEGFEDARIEFQHVYDSKSNPGHYASQSSSNQSVSQSGSNRPVPLPRILHPPREATSFLAHSLTASTSNLWNATAAAVRSRRQHAPSSKPDHTSKQPATKHVNWKNNEDNSEANGFSNKNSTINASNDPANKKSCLAAPPSPSDNCTTVSVPKVRRSSDHVHSNVKQPRVKRSVSYTDGQDPTEENKDIQMEWKVRVSRDGTRYITKRPVRERILREREKRLLAERCVTTDDDHTELKLGRHWSRDDRKRQLRVAREKKRRRELMLQSRLEVLNESTPADGEIVELSQKRMSRQKHKRMLLDNFVTVQELLARGDKSTSVANINPLLSVTYI